MLDESFYNVIISKPKYGKTKTGKWVRLYTKSEILGMNLSDMKYRSDSIT